MNHFVARIILSLLLIACVLIFISGCCGDCFMDPPKDEHPPRYDGERYFPLENSNYWRFSINGHPELWVQIAISDTFMWGDRVLHQIGTSTNDNLPEFTNFSNLVWFENDSLLQTALSFIRSNMNPMPFASLRIINPLREGDSLVTRPQSVYNHDPNWGHYKWSIDNVDTSVTTPYAKFSKCIQLRLWYQRALTNETHVLAEEFYSLDNGLVQFKEYPFDVSPGDLGDSLIRYDLIEMRLTEQ